MKSLCTVHLLGKQMVKSFENVRKEEINAVMQKLEKASSSSLSIPITRNMEATNLLENPLEVPPEIPPEARQEIPPEAHTESPPKKFTSDWLLDNSTTRHAQRNTFDLMNKEKMVEFLI
ncbi:hypothetical protein Bca4012_087492 [Brassica carinata]|uniref:Uncharacterized protein n=1 Tax=Brassica oleracea TaxID=3712 RepID=A0A3P6EUV3_BRAOL|nr:unnamed protein product [Brassica oleracea]